MGIKEWSEQDLQDAMRVVQKRNNQIQAIEYVTFEDISTKEDIYSTVNKEVEYIVGNKINIMLGSDLPVNNNLWENMNFVLREFFAEAVDEFFYNNKNLLRKSSQSL